MKWNVEPLPKDGDVRFVKKFAWVPVRVISALNQKEADEIGQTAYWNRPSTKKIVWLETYQQVQVYYNVVDYWKPQHNFIMEK